MTQKHRPLVSLGALAALSACTGQIDPGGATDPLTGEVSTSPVAGPRTPTGTPSSPGARPPAGQPTTPGATGTVRPGGGPPSLRLLSRTELRNTLQDVLGVATTDDPDLTLGDASLSNLASPATDYLGANDFQLLDAMLATVADQVVARQQGSPDACRDGAGVPTCVDGFLAGLGRRLFRRPMARSELDGYRNLYLAEKTRREHGLGLALAVRGLLLSPHFLYRSEVGEPVAPGIHRLTDWEYASALAFTVTRSAPDDVLLGAAESGALRGADRVRTEIKRLLGGKRGAEGVVDFYTRWLRLSDFPLTEKAGPYKPLFTAAVKTAAMREFAETIKREILSGQGGFRTLLTTTRGFGADRTATAALQALYGGTVPAATGFFELDAKVRAGVFTQLAFLMTASKEFDSNPMHAGALVFEKLLCQPLPTPPDVAGIPFDANPALSRRDNLIARTTSTEVCRACHGMLNDVALPFDAYDAVGRHRTKVDGFAVDESGQLKGARDAQGSFQGVPGMMQILARSHQVTECQVAHWLEYALGRGHASDDEPSLKRVHDAFGARNFDVPAMLAELALSDAFVNRRLP